MIEKLLGLDYKRICDFEDERLRERLEFLVGKRSKPENATYFAKVLDQTIEYEMDDGSTFQNRISLTIFFLASEPEGNMYDCFCMASYPFEMRTQEDFDVLANLYGIYRDDIREVMEDEKETGNHACA